MKCYNCGTEVNNGRFCTNCGIEMRNEHINSTETTKNENIRINSLKEFYSNYASQKTKNWVGWFVAMSFLSAIVQIIALLNGNILSILDIIAYLVFAIGVIVSKRWIFALIATIYCGLFMLLNLLLVGAFSGYIYLIVAIIVTNRLYKVNDSYNEYLSTGILSETEI